MSQLTLKSSAFQDGGLIPRLHTCDGRDVSPALFWTGAPEGVKTFALIVDDPDAPRKTFVHWVVFDLPSGAAALPEGVPPGPAIEGGGSQGFNDFGKLGYGGPCPPSGTHNYVFTLYAASARLDLTGRVTKEEVLHAIQKRVLAQVRLTGRYSRK